MTDRSPTPTSPTAWKRNTVLFLTGQVVSLFGSMVVQFVVMWWVTLETKSGLAIGLYALVAFAPQGVVSIFGGVFADRVNRKRLVILADATIALVTLFLAIIMTLGITQMWIILLAVGIRSFGAGVQAPTVQAMIPQIVPSDQLMRVNGMFQTINAAMALVAPAVAAAIYAGFGIVPVFYLDVVTAVIGIGFLLLVTVPPLARSREAVVSYREDLVEGMRYIWHHPVVRWLLGVFAVIFLLTVAPNFITPLMVAREFGEQEWKLAVLEISFSIGMMIGGALLSTVLAQRSRIALVVLATYGFAALTIGLGLSPNLWIFYGFMFIFGVTLPMFATPVTTLMQQIVPQDKQGRVFSYFGIVMALATPIGMVVFGPLADVVSVQTLLIAGGLVTAVVMTIAVMLPSGRAAIAAAREMSTEKS